MVIEIKKLGTTQEILLAAGRLARAAEIKAITMRSLASAELRLTKLAPATATHIIFERI